MGVYLVSVDAIDWAEDDVLQPARPKLAAALRERGLPEYAGPPTAQMTASGEGDHFEEKLCRPDRGYGDLRRRLLPSDLLQDTAYWDMIVPVDLEGLIRLDVPSAYEHTTTVANSRRVLQAMTILAKALALPTDHLPARSDNLDITDWFDEVEAATIVAPTGPWREDLDTAFYVAMFLRGAQFSLQHSCPMRYV